MKLGYGFIYGQVKYDAGEYEILRNFQDLYNKYQNKDYETELLNRFWKEILVPLGKEYFTDGTFQVLKKDNRNFKILEQTLNCFTSSYSVYREIPSLIFGYLYSDIMEEEIRELSKNKIDCYIHKKSLRACYQRLLEEGQYVLINKSGGFIAFEPSMLEQYDDRPMERDASDSRNHIRVYVLKESGKEKWFEIDLPEYNFRMQISASQFEQRAIEIARLKAEEENAIDWDWCFNCLGPENNIQQYMELFIKANLMPEVGRFNMAYKLIYSKLMEDSSNAVWLFYDSGFGGSLLDKNSCLLHACWLLPDGSEIGLDFGCHYTFAKEVLGKEEEELEQMGWIKINKMGPGGSFNAMFVKEPTKEQKKFLKKLEKINLVQKQFLGNLDWR